jgi:hypothetical protein
MNDFLSNLIGRSFTDAPVIQPRLPSLFETSADEFSHEAQSSAAAMTAPEAIAPADAFAVASKSPATPETGKTPITNASEARAEGHLPRADAPEHKRAPVIAEPPQPSEQAARVKKLEVETKRIIVPVDSWGDGEKDAEDKRVSESFSQPRSGQSPRRRAFSPAERSSKSAPIIRVTIGRVEVRAIHPPAPSPKSAKPAPSKVSLEDYLRKRERGLP